LELEGYNATAYLDGTAALGMISRIKPDVILLDLKLTGKSGFQIAYELKSFSKTAHIPVIAMTGFYTRKEHAELMNICGIQTYLLKPFDSQELVGKIETVLKRRG
ncbi:response regulator, partial [bacterium]|nr:response regulator [bacterium]NIO72923.1 response regulator [bacterium]